MDSQRLNITVNEVHIGQRAERVLGKVQHLRQVGTVVGLVLVVAGTSISVTSDEVDLITV